MRAPARRALLAGVAFLLLATACEEPPAPGCDDDPDVDCCEVEPERDECQLPTCAADPLLPECQPSCDEDPAQAGCREECSSDPEAPHCVPASRRPGAPVDVYRDSLGVPHAFAATREDAMWASGYLQASDRMWQMDLARRRAQGRQAEVLGSGSVGDDTLMRVVGIHRLAEAGLHRLRTERPDLYGMLIAWTAGVNARIDEVVTGNLPLPAGFTEFGYAPEPWAIADGAAVGKLLLFGSSNQIENDILATVIRDYLPDVWDTVPILMPLEPAFTVPTEEQALPHFGRSVVAPGSPRELPADFAERMARFRQAVGAVSGDGSNNWAVAGAHTENGRPLIAGDPHQPLRTPSLFWAHHVHSADGAMDVAGFSFVGAPGVHLGHNASVVWTATLNYPDMMDMWAVPVRGNVATVGEQDITVRRRIETIAVAGGDDVVLEVDSVPGFGVFLPDDLPPVPVVEPGQRILFNWTGFAATNDFEAFQAINTAEDVGAFEAAVDTIEIGAFNFVAADQSDIAYVSSYWLPERQSVTPERLPWTIQDGTDPMTLWTDALVDRAMLPRTRGAGRGWVGTANNDPLGFTSDGDSTNDAYYFGVYFDPGTRAGRIYSELDRLTAAGDLTLEDMQALQTDTHSVLADHMVPLLEAAWAALPTDDALAEYRDLPALEVVHDLLTGWDRRMSREQSAPVAFTALVFFFTQRAVADEFGLAFEAVLGAETVYMLKVPLLAAEGAWAGSEALFGDEGVHGAVLASLRQTALWLENRYGSADPASYLWSDLHCTSFRGVADVPGLDGGCLASDGGDGTVNVSSSGFLSGGAPRERHEAGGGAIYRMVSSFGDDGVPEARVSFPRGNSEDPASPWFDNNLEGWLAGDYVDLPFRRAEVEADAQETSRLE